MIFCLKRVCGSTFPISRSFLIFILYIVFIDCISLDGSSAAVVRRPTSRGIHHVHTPTDTIAFRDCRTRGDAAKYRPRRVRTVDRTAARLAEERRAGARQAPRARWRADLPIAALSVNLGRVHLRPAAARGARRRCARFRPDQATCRRSLRRLPAAICYYVGTYQWLSPAGSAILVRKDSPIKTTRRPEGKEGCVQARVERA